MTTAPIASMFLGTALGTVPASMWMARVGRRTGFVAGATIGAAGGLLAALGIFAGSLLPPCVGTLVVGVYQVFAQFYRFAASEVADDAFRPRAISLVLAGGVVAALAKPTLARIGGDWLQPIYSGSFLLLAVVSMLAVGLLLGLKVPAAETSADNCATARSMAAIAQQPTYLVALFGAATSYGIMILAMTATPLAMVHHHHSLADASVVIQLHVLGMFLPSFITRIPDRPVRCAFGDGRRHRNSGRARVADVERNRVLLVCRCADPARRWLELSLGLASALVRPVRFARWAQSVSATH